MPGPDLTERIRIVRKHLEFSIQWKGDKKGIYEMRRHYTNYFKGIPDFKPYRIRLVQSGTFEEISALLTEIQDVFAGNLIQVNA